MITPAVSVLSAVEGLTTVSPASRRSSCRSRSDPDRPVRDPGARHGAGRLLFGPIMLVYFAVLAVLGVIHRQAPDESSGCSTRWYAVEFFRSTAAAFLALGSVVLAVTGAEALYADMGHFGRKPIRRVLAVLRAAGADAQLYGAGRAAADARRRRRSKVKPVLPAGAGWAAPAAGHPRDTGATIIASQAVISGAFR
jgi:KUP system potassium uptake protein